MTARLGSLGMIDINININILMFLVSIYFGMGRTGTPEYSCCQQKKKNKRLDFNDVTVTVRLPVA